MLDVQNPIYSAETECQDCYKCIRQCPVKAIRVENNHAAIVPDLCIACGHCVDICPSGAKRVRDDLSLAQQVVRNSSRVIASLAPSFISEFPDVTPSQMIQALKALGFFGVSETALGAQQVSAHLGTLLDTVEHQLVLSSACPVAVEFVLRYLPAHAEHITRLYSPLLAHCAYLKNIYGEATDVVFIGPCIAKKFDAQAHPELLNVAITFEDLHVWFEQAGIVPQDIPKAENALFIPENAREGALYPIEGGMVEATRLHCRHQRTTQFMSLSGIKNIERALNGLDVTALHGNLFLELLACDGGCVNGPKSHKQSLVMSRLRVTEHTELPTQATKPEPLVAIDMPLPANTIAQPVYTEEQIVEVLRRIGKTSDTDELNCGGCGYDSCRDFATAVLANKAETSMCVSYMRTLAQKKANALIRTMPYGVVIVNDDLRIIECNEQFARMCGEDAMLAYEAQPGLANAILPKLLPFADLFDRVVRTGEEIIRQNIRVQGRMVSASIFTIEEHHVIGAILLDVTQTEAHRAQIIEKAQQVITNTLSTAQEIAFLMGKNAAESECILNSIIEGFSAHEPEEDHASV